jgi:hypothetical protein
VFYIAGLSLIIQASMHPPLSWIAMFITAYGELCLAMHFALLFVWLGLSWAMIPPAGRRTDSGRAISPAQAVGYLFIPFYNLYWVFVVSMGLCEALDRQLAAFGVARRAPGGLAVAMSIVQVLPCVNLVLGPLLWLPYIFLVDAAKAAYRRAALGVG